MGKRFKQRHWSGRTARLRATAWYLEHYRGGLSSLESIIKASEAMPAGVDPDFDGYGPIDLDLMLSGAATHLQTMYDTRGNGEPIPQMLRPDDPGMAGGRWASHEKIKRMHPGRKRGRPRKQHPPTISRERIFLNLCNASTADIDELPPFAVGEDIDFHGRRV